MPHADHFLRVSADSISVHTDGWVDANCPTEYLSVDGKIRGEEEWTSMASRVRPGEEFTLRYLTPATWFHVKVNLSAFQANPGHRCP